MPRQAPPVRVPGPQAVVVNGFAGYPQSHDPATDAVLVRPARQRDVDDIVSMWRCMMAFHHELDTRFQFEPDAPTQFRKLVRGALRDRSACLYVAELEGSLVGYVMAHLAPRPPVYPVGRYGFISDLYVLERWRRMGIGGALLRHAVAWLSARAVTAVELLAAERNLDAHAFWEAMGFRQFLVLYRMDLEQTSERAGGGQRL